MACPPGLGSTASAIKLQQDCADFRMQTEHRVRQVQIKALVDSLHHGSLVRKVAQKPAAAAAAAAVPTSSCRKRHIGSDEERRQCILAKRRQEKLHQNALREERELEEMAKVRRRAREREHCRRDQTECRIAAKKTANKKLAVAQEYRNRAHMLYRGWLPWTRRVKDVKLQEIKAERHHHYCLAQSTWSFWIAAVQCSRAAKTQSTKRRISRMVSRLEFTLQRQAWKRWQYHQLRLATASRRVRGQVHLALLSSHWQKWINAWTCRSRCQYGLEQRASRMGEHAVKSRLFQAWKAEADSTRVNLLLVEERCRIWEQVNLWLMPQIASASPRQRPL